jgi:hypothetical protein
VNNNSRNSKQDLRQKTYFPLVWTRNGGLTEEMKQKNNIISYEWALNRPQKPHSGKLVIFKDTNKGKLEKNTLTLLNDLSHSFSHAFQQIDSLYPPLRD